MVTIMRASMAEAKDGTTFALAKWSPKRDDEEKDYNDSFLPELQAPFLQPTYL
jgi:hypothetical protein